MKKPEGTKSVWQDRPLENQFYQFSGSASVDVCVIGGGITGLTCAYLLAKENLKVLLLEAREFGSGETSRTSAHLASATDDYFHKIEEMHGKEASRKVYASHGSAINLIEQICSTNSIECDFMRVPGFLWSANKSGRALLEKERDAAKRAGFADVELLKEMPFWSGKVPQKNFCLKFPNQAQFHANKYLAGLLNAVSSSGVKIHTNSRVEKVEAGKQVKVHLEGGVVEAKATVVATNVPIHGASLFTNIGSYRSYVIGCAIPKGSIQAALFWDIEDPYHYVRVLNDGEKEDDLLLIGGEDHRVGQGNSNEKHFANLHAWASSNFGELPEPVYTWSGEIIEPADGLAFIGKDPFLRENVYLATGDSGMGLTHGTIAGILLTDLIAGRPNDWESLYSPSRLPFADTANLVHENLSSGIQFVRNVIPSIANEKNLHPGEGCVKGCGLKKVAVSLDRDGNKHNVSAHCTHLDAVVTWNAVEQSWDCPAHGSRFSREGAVLFGPANRDLPIVDADG